MCVFCCPKQFKLQTYAAGHWIISVKNFLQLWKIREVRASFHPYLRLFEGCVNSGLVWECWYNPMQVQEWTAPPPLLLLPPKKRHLLTAPLQFRIVETLQQSPPKFLRWFASFYFTSELLHLFHRWFPQCIKNRAKNIKDTVNFLSQLLLHLSFPQPANSLPQSS